MAGIGDDAPEVCRRLLGVEPVAVEFPGGRSRKSVRLRLDGRSVIVTRRRDQRRAELERQVLRALRAEGAAVPTVLAAEGHWLVQEDLGGRRLSEELAQASAEVAAGWLARALDSLAAIHRAGRAAGLQRQVVQLGTETDWLQRFAQAPEQLGGWLQRPAPGLEIDAVVARLRPPRLCLIKWDARPGNAVVREAEQTVGWFDWEHCGCRHPLDDLAWLLGDEYMPDREDDEAALLERHLGDFAWGLEGADARAYLACFATLHMCMRLALILWNKGDEPWWDADYCLQRDKVAVTRDAAVGLCARAARWAPQAPETAPLADWFGGLAEVIPRQ